jgi:CheY-like chemotaxis protein
VILIVDDEPDMLENVARILRRGPYRCVTAASGQEAMATLRDAPPDLVLTDLRMPGMDGLAVLRATKRLAPRTPVVIVTAYASDSVTREATSAGAAACLAKPFTGGELLETIQRALEAHPAIDRP